MPYVAVVAWYRGHQCKIYAVGGGRWGHAADESGLHTSSCKVERERSVASTRGRFLGSGIQVRGGG